MPEKILELSVVLPVYNEEEEILPHLRIIEEKLLALGISYEIIVVNDGSKDSTLSQARAYASPHVKVLSYDKNQGKGFAVRNGMLQAAGQFSVFMDIDLSTSLDAFESFLKRMRETGCDIIIGDRKTSTGSQVVKQPFYRRLLGRGFTYLSCLCVGRYFKDFTCGFKMFNKKSIQIVFNRQKISGWAFDTELIHIACLHGLKIRQVPVSWKHHSASTVRPLKDVFTSLSGLIRIKINSWKGLYR